MTRASFAVLALVLAMAVVTGCGGDGEPQPTTDNPLQATVAQVLRDPDAFDLRPVVVEGEAYRIGDLGFLLADDGRSIFVGAPASDLEQLEKGERVRVRGELEQLSETRAETIQDALDATSEAIEGLPSPVYERSVGPDKPFLNLRLLYGAEG